MPSGNNRLHWVHSEDGEAFRGAGSRRPRKLCWAKGMGKSGGRERREISPETKARIRKFQRRYDLVDVALSARGYRKRMLERAKQAEDVRLTNLFVAKGEEPSKMPRRVLVRLIRDAAKARGVPNLLERWFISSGKGDETIGMVGSRHRPSKNHLVELLERLRGMTRLPDGRLSVGLPSGEVVELGEATDVRLEAS